METPSQKNAIEKQKKFFASLYSNAKFDTYTPHLTNDLVLMCRFSYKNMLGTQTEAARSWLIGKRGKITESYNSITKD